MKKKLSWLLLFAVMGVLVVTCTSEKAVKTPGSPAPKPYEPKDFSNLIGMEGFSDALLKTHFKLYEGYVKNSNLLLDKLHGTAEAGRADSPEYAELKRRLGFEFNGMRLHEYYFANLGGSGQLKPDNRLYEALKNNFGGFEKWRQDFIDTGAMRGIGWVVLYEDTTAGRLINMWINDHETGHLAGCNPLLVMDVFEHAYLLDYGLDRRRYIDNFFKHIDWAVVAERFGIEGAAAAEAAPSFSGGAAVNAGRGEAPASEGASKPAAATESAAAQAQG